MQDMQSLQIQIDELRQRGERERVFYSVGGQKIVDGATVFFVQTDKPSFVHCNGKTRNGRSVTIKDNGLPIATAFTDSDGNFSLSFVLSEKENEISVEGDDLIYITADIDDCTYAESGIPFCPVSGGVAYTEYGYVVYERNTKQTVCSGKLFDGFAKNGNVYLFVSNGDGINLYVLDGNENISTPTQTVVSSGIKALASFGTDDGYVLVYSTENGLFYQEENGERTTGKISNCSPLAICSDKENKSIAYRVGGVTYQRNWE